jgi:hypothetical protein
VTLKVASNFQLVEITEQKFWKVLVMRNVTSLNKHWTQFVAGYSKIVGISARDLTNSSI